MPAGTRAVACAGGYKCDKLPWTLVRVCNRSASTGCVARVRYRGALHCLAPRGDRCMDVTH